MCRHGVSLAGNANGGPGGEHVSPLCGSTVASLRCHRIRSFARFHRSTNIGIELAVAPAAIFLECVSAPGPSLRSPAVAPAHRPPRAPLFRPPLLYRSEPTSGLDSSAALEVCRTLRSIADLGLTVVAVIHQPRLEIFTTFDDLLLLAPGGLTAYIGPRGACSGHRRDSSFAAISS